MTNSNKVKIQPKLLNFKNLFSIGLSILAVAFSYLQKPVIGQVCYAQTEEGSTLDLSYLCQEKPTRRETIPFTSMPEEQQRAILDNLSNQVNKACGQVPGRCESETELMNVIKKVCSGPDSCPDYINEGLRSYPQR